MHKFLTACLVFILAQNISVGQAPAKMLLLDEKVALEATDAVNDMYNFKFDRAEEYFQELKHRFPKHPLPHFLMGLSQWWKIMPNLDVGLEKYDDVFLAYMDSSITLGEEMYDNDHGNVEAAFFLSAAYGFKARLYSERKKYSKATFAGKNALDYLEKYSQNNDLSPEFLFGEALFNYYAVWIRDNYPLLRPILVFFPKGNKELGIKQLKQSSYNAFYTRTEAQYFLMRIYSVEEEKDELALPIARYLATTFPDNAYFQRSFARLAFSQGQWQEAETVSYDILYKLNIGMPGYEDVSGRYASFFLAYINRNKYRNNEKAKEYFKKAIIYAEKTDATKMNYYLYSLTGLAQIANEEKDYNTARQYYKTVLKKADNKDAVHKEAKEYLSKKPTKK